VSLECECREPTLSLLKRAKKVAKKWSGKEVALPPLPPLRTGRETFASSGSSRTKAPRERSRCHTMCHLYDTRLQPPRLAFTLGPGQSVPVRCLARRRTHGQIHVHLLFLLRRFYRFSRNERPCWKSARLRGRVETATPIRPITGRPWLSPAFLCPHSHNAPCGNVCLPRGGMSGLPCSARTATNDLAPAFYTGSRRIRVPAY
jgi:hypothetical protein